MFYFGFYAIPGFDIGQFTVLGFGRIRVQSPGFKRKIPKKPSTTRRSRWSRYFHSFADTLIYITKRVLIYSVCLCIKIYTLYVMMACAAANELRLFIPLVHIVIKCVFHACLEIARLCKFISKHPTNLHTNSRARRSEYQLRCSAINLLTSQWVVSTVSIFIRDLRVYCTHVHCRRRVCLGFFASS